MLEHFHVASAEEVRQCVDIVKKFAQKFGFSDHESELLALAISEAGINAVRYADGAEIEVSTTSNKKGISITVTDRGKGIQNLEESMQEGYTTQENSLGLGFSTIKRSVDELKIIKNDATGFSIRVQKYLNSPDYDCSELSIKKEGESFDGDKCLIKHYRGDCSLFAVLDGAGSGLKAHQASEFIKEVILENYTLALDDLVRLCHEKLCASPLSRGVEIVLVRISPEGLEYLTLGSTFIKSYPHHSFVSYRGSLGLSIKGSLLVNHIELEENFCLCLCSDGIDNSFELYETYKGYTAHKFAVALLNNYNIDDDSSVVVVKR